MAFILKLFYSLASSYGVGSVIAVPLAEKVRIRYNIAFQNIEQLVKN